MALAFAFTQMAPAVTVFYVTTNGTGLGTSWADATNNLQGAIDAIETGAANTVWVSNGVYEVGGWTNYPSGTVLTNRVAIWKAITVRSANNDPTNTIIKGAKDNGTNGPASVRCVYMTNGSALIGFTLTNGATLQRNYPTTGTNNNHYGGGVWCQSTSATISNCVIVGNSADYYGGGTYYGTLYGCTVAGNVSMCNGGGSYAGSHYNSTYVSNQTAINGGGLSAASIVSNCTLIGNSAVGNSGGGASYCTLYNCTVISNYAGSGGGTHAGTVYNSTITYNRSGGGGGMFSSIMYNCLLFGNAVVAGAQIGGGAREGSLYNCTIVGNYVSNTGGGTYLSTLSNCISWNNNIVDYLPNAYNSCGVGYTNGGSVSGNITNDPMFVANGTEYGTNHVAGNYRLSANSPCINAGTNGSWTTSYPDLDGHRRIDRLSGRVDMGAY